MATQGCYRSADSAAGMKGGTQPPFRTHSGGNALNPKGLGTESPTSSAFRHGGAFSTGRVFGDRAWTDEFQATRCRFMLKW